MALLERSLEQRRGVDSSINYDPTNDVASTRFGGIPGVNVSLTGNGTVQLVLDGSKNLDQITIIGNGSEYKIPILGESVALNVAQTGSEFTVGLY